MIRKIAVGLFVLTAVMVLNNYAFAQMCGVSCQAKADKVRLAEAKAENVGNKICPVTGEKIDETTKATYTYEGKTYNFCCAMCIDAFKNEPQKYIKKVNEELNKNSK